MECSSVLRALDYKIELGRVISNVTQMGSVSLAATYLINSPIDFDPKDLEEQVLCYITKERWDEIVEIYEALK